MVAAVLAAGPATAAAAAAAAAKLLPSRLLCTLATLTFGAV
jgi:hypothetical protein